MVIACDLCGKQLTEDGEDHNAGELTLRGSRLVIDLCDDCAGPLLEKLDRLDSLECPECGRKFPKKHGLMMHRLKAHGISPDEK